MTFGEERLTYQTTATQPENGISFRCCKKDPQCQGSFKLHTYPTQSNVEVLLPLCLHSCGAEIPTLENVITKFEGLLDGSIKKINNQELENTTAHYCTFLKKHKDWYIEKASLKSIPSNVELINPMDERYLYTVVSPPQYICDKFINDVDRWIGLRGGNSK